MCEVEEHPQRGATRPGGEEHRTLVDALLFHGGRVPDRPLITFDDGDGHVETWSYGETLARARQAAAAWQRAGARPGDRVVIVGGNRPATVALLLGAMGSGLVPAVVRAPLRAEVEAQRAHLAAVLGRAAPSVVVAPRRQWPRVAEGTRVFTAEELLAGSTAGVDLVAPASHSVAYIQFSSGSTGSPKAVMITARSQAINAAATGHEIAACRETWVIWLPLYHDMGLMSGLMVPLYCGDRVVLMPPERFVERPMSWLTAIHEHRGTVTVAPNFAYALVARRATPERAAALDLSCLRVAYNGAEMVNAATVERFEQRLAPAGLRPHTLYPVYGLAEHTLSAVFWRVGTPIRVECVVRSELARGRALPAPPGECRVVTLVSVGRPISGHRLRLVADDGHACAEREVGEIQVAGPSRMLGYLGDPARTAAVFDGEWLRTGDLGYVAGGDLFVCGRKKDMVVRFGENFYPAELEAVAAAAPGVKPGRLAVVGVEDPEMATERVWLVIEAEALGEAAVALAQAARAHALAAAGFKFDGVSVVPPGFIEKTSSGKVRRFACRDRLAALFRLGPEPPGVGRWPGAVG